MCLQGCEREVADAEKGSSDELKSECIMRLSWALVHSRRPEDIQRGIAMLEGQCSRAIHFLVYSFSFRIHAESFIPSPWHFFARTVDSVFQNHSM